MALMHDRLLISLLAALPDDVEGFRQRIGALGTDGGELWQRLLDEAATHGVLGVIAVQLNGSELPAAVRESLDRRAAIEHLWSGQLRSALEQAAAALARAGVVSCALKGPVLAARLYADPAVRASMDIDLLVRPEDFDRAAAALHEAGYSGDSVVTAGYLRRHAHHLHFVKPGTPSLELHFHAYSGFGIVVPAGALMDRAVEYRLRDDLGLLVASPEDEFVYLAVHAAGHSFIRLVWLYDLKLFVRRYPSLDWAAVARAAESLGVATAVAYTARLLNRWLAVDGMKLPAPFMRRALRAWVADWLLAEASRPQPVSARDNLGGLLFTSLLCDTTGRSVSLVRHHGWRTIRRRLQRLAPDYLPEQWSA